MKFGYTTEKKGKLNCSVMTGFGEEGGGGVTTSGRIGVAVGRGGQVIGIV